MDHFFQDFGPCHVHKSMRVRKPHLQDKPPVMLCLLCDRPFCDEHKGKQYGVCEVNHVTYYRNHPERRNEIYRTYDDWKKDYDEMMLGEMSADEGRKEDAPTATNTGTK
ncbi:hypothetical protein V8C44DRAFT_335230 [Trichoderma aethiopicum]